MRLRHLALLAMITSLGSGALLAAPPAPAGPASERVLDTAVVRVPGPGLWAVRKDGHTLWVLGTVSPLPAGMAWNASRVHAVIREADAVIAGPSIVVGADIGFFGKLALAPSLLGARTNPAGSLSEVLPAPMYARWAALKGRHLGRDASVEKWRPLFAAGKLYDEAIRGAGLSRRDVVRAGLADAIKARGLKPVATAAHVQVGKPRAVLKEFKSTRFDDIDCFEKTLDRVEADLPALSARAQAWAVGDVEALRHLRNPDLDRVCERAMLSGQFAARHGMDTLETQARAAWLKAAEATLAKHRTSFAILPMDEVLGRGGLVAALGARGYAVEAPAARGAGAVSAPSSP